VITVGYWLVFSPSCKLQTKPETPGTYIHRMENLLGLSAKGRTTGQVLLHTYPRNLFHGRDNLQAMDRSASHGQVQAKNHRHGTTL
jgi:hypothetical protein